MQIILLLYYKSVNIQLFNYDYNVKTDPIQRTRSC